MEPKVKYTLLSSGNWIIEAMSIEPLLRIQNEEWFYDNDNKRHSVKEIIYPVGVPTPPYTNYIEVIVED